MVEWLSLTSESRTLGYWPHPSCSWLSIFQLQGHLLSLASESSVDRSTWECARGSFWWQLLLLGQVHISREVLHFLHRLRAMPEGHSSLVFSEGCDSGFPTPTGPLPLCPPLLLINMVTSSFPKLVLYPAGWRKDTLVQMGMLSPLSTRGCASPPHWRRAEGRQHWKRMHLGMQRHSLVQGQTWLEGVLFNLHTIKFGTVIVCLEN